MQFTRRAWGYLAITTVLPIGAFDVVCLATNLKTWGDFGQAVLAAVVTAAAAHAVCIAYDRRRGAA